MTKTRLTRRTLLGSIFGFIFGFPAGAQDRDRGIGGTGVVIQPPEDRGIGGTGVIGTIREFGSIIVNDMRIAYSQYAMLEIDGEPAPLVDMRIGQVVQVVAASTAAGLETDRITIVNEVVGPITAVKKGALTVLGQTVSTRHIGDKGWKKGRWVAVSGLRQLDGTIVASLAQFKERRPGEERVRRVVGPVTIAPDGGAQIGGLKARQSRPGPCRKEGPRQGRARQGRRHGAEDHHRPGTLRHARRGAHLDRSLCRQFRRRGAFGLRPHGDDHVGGRKPADPRLRHGRRQTRRHADGHE